MQIRGLIGGKGVVGRAEKRENERRCRLRGTKTSSPDTAGSTGGMVYFWY